MEVSEDTLPGTSESFSDTTKIQLPNSLNELIQQLHKVFSIDKVNVEYVKTLMGQYKSNRQEWKKFAKFDRHSLRYTRNLVDTGNDRFNLMVLCWNESQGSSIHDHAGSHCFLKVLDGTVKEELYDWPSDSEADVEYGPAMSPRQTLVFDKDQVTYIHDDIGLHRVENPSHTDKAVTLHLYSPPFDYCDAFDQRTGHRRMSQVTFWSQFGKRTPFTTSSVEKMQEDAENN